MGRFPEQGSTTTGALAGAAAVVLLGMAAALGYLVVAEEAKDPAPPTVLTGTPSPQAAEVSPSPSGPPDLTTLFARVQDGVVRIEVTTCFGSGTGSGALVAPDLVLTAAHVVDGAATVQLLAGTTSSIGTVIGLVTERDLALVRSERPFPGYVFDVADQTPDVGTGVVALGYPLSGGLSLTGPGVVSAHDEEVDYDGTAVNGLMRTNLLTNRGNSGGPVLDASGVLVGLVSGGAVSSGVLDPATGRVAIDDVNGIDYAVPAGVISPDLARWRTNSEPPEPTECEIEEEADLPVDRDLVTALVEAPEGDAVVATLTDYAEGINSGDYARAHAQLSPSRQQRIPYQDFREQQRTSYLSDVVIARLVEQDGGLRATTIFISRQDAEFGPDGLTCALWTLDYALVEGGPNGWQLDGAAEVPGRPQFQPC